MFLIPMGVKEQARVSCTVKYSTIKNKKGACKTIGWKTWTHLFLYRLVCTCFRHIHFFLRRSFFHLLDMLLFFLLFDFFVCNLWKNANCSLWNFTAIFKLVFFIKASTTLLLEIDPKACEKSSACEKSFYSFKGSWIAAQKAIFALYYHALRSQAVFVSRNKCYVCINR